MFAALFDPPLSVPRLAQAYAVERADLIARLARIDIHLALAEFSTRLFAEGSAQGYPLVSYQQPWAQTDIIFGHRQTLRYDAAFLLASPQRTEHAFYVRVDTDERNPFDRKRERILLLRLLNLRHALHLQRETMPQLLIITRASRLAAWGELLSRCSEQRGTALLDGAITTLDHLQRCGAHGPIWWTFATLVQRINGSSLANLTDPSVRLSDLMGVPATQSLAERFSQRQTFAHLLTERNSNSLRQTVKPLPSYVGKSLMDETVACVAHPWPMLSAERKWNSKRQPHCSISRFLPCKRICYSGSPIIRFSRSIIWQRFTIQEHEMYEESKSKWLVFLL